jgi:hypothetical protein
MMAGHRLRTAFGTALAAGAVTLLLSACGGGASTEPEQAQAPSSSHPADPGRRSAQAVEEPSPHPDRSQKKSSEAGERKPVTKAKAEQAQETHVPSRAPREPKRGSCPGEISRRLCAELAEAPDPKKIGTPATRETGCPPALSEGECREAGQTDEQNPDSQAVPAGACPPVLTEAQCQEVARAYEEATE